MHTRMYTHTHTHVCICVYICPFSPTMLWAENKGVIFLFRRWASGSSRAPSHAGSQQCELQTWTLSVTSCPSQTGHRQTSSVRAFQPGLFFCASSHGSHLPWITGLQTWRKWNKRAHSFKFTRVCLALFPILPFYPVFFFPPEVDKREPTCYLIIFENSILVNAYLLHYEHTN